MKTKVAIIIERADVALGGAERSVSELAEAIGAIGYETHILAAKGQSTAQNVHILCADMPGKRTSYQVFARELKNISRTIIMIFFTAFCLLTSRIFISRGAGLLPSQ